MNPRTCQTDGNGIGMRDSIFELNDEEESLEWDDSPALSYDREDREEEDE